MGWGGRGREAERGKVYQCTNRQICFHQRVILNRCQNTLTERCSLTCFERYMYSSRRARELSALYGLSPPLPPSQLHPSPFFGSVGQSTVGLVDRSKAMESNLRGHMGRKLIGDENKLDRLSIVLDLLLPSNVLSRENMAVFILSPFFFVCAVRDNTLAQTLSLSVSLSLARSLALSVISTKPHSRPRFPAPFLQTMPSLVTPIKAHS